ncbi:hypothetical protein ATO49_12695 [Mycolicibacterium fortuitum subsp. fortuitum DSM 46621 = ATCC 6841 = JCM 6387]|nr:hypothetical protein ATO49_12695 [Mycolicibacterium fortuitum subsp. fortuitum DSM 46621 = ATCC 6841 = JCM 6387]
MTGDTTQSATWQNTLPHFSTVEKHGHITMPVPQPSETLRFFAVVTFILWIPVAVGAAFWIHSMQTQDPSIWIGIAAIVGSFLPAILSGIVADEARDTFGQRSTGNRVALIPALAASQSACWGRQCGSAAGSAGSWHWSAWRARPAPHSPPSQRGRASATPVADAIGW